MVSLKVYVNNKWEELELDNKFVVSMNASLSSLVNPTDYLTDYTKTVEIPLTAKNRKIFNEYVETNSLVVGNRFDPTKPVKVKISSNNSEIFDGYLQVSKVDLSANKLAGNIYGFMNQFFTKLNALNFDDGSLPEMLTAGALINKTYVYNCWNQQKSERTLELKMPGETGHNDIDIVGFAPTIQGNPAQFNTESGIWGQNVDGTGGPRTGNFWELLGDGTLTDDETKSAQTIIKVPSERITCQYRSYTQKPYIVMNKLIQLFKNVAMEKTGCELVLDPDFFNDTNPLYTDVIYTLPSLTTETSDNDSVHSEESVVGGGDYTTFNTSSTSTHIKTKTYNTFRTTSNGTLQINGTIKNTAHLAWHSTGGGTGRYFNWNGNAGIRVKIELFQQGASSAARTMTYKYSGIGNQETETSTYKLLLVGNKYPDPYPPSERSAPFNYYWYQDQKNFAFKWENLLANTYYYVKMTYEIIGVGSGQYAFGRYFTADGMSPVATQNYNGTASVTVALSGKVFYTESKRSNSSLSLARLWHEVDGTPFEVVMKYCKMLNLVFDYDNRTKTVTLMTRQKYFANSRNNIKDWSKKLDTTRDYSFKPLQWDSRYVTFNYDKTDVDRLADFAAKYGFEYGSKKIDTGYEFNSNNKDFFDKQLINCSATMSEYYYSIKAIHDIVTDYAGAGANPKPELSWEQYIINRKGDKTANISNSFYFRNENEFFWNMGIWDPKMAGGGVTEKSPYYVYITDDCEYENQANTYCTQYCWRFSTTGQGATRVENTTNYICTGEVAMNRPVFSVYDDSGSYCLQYSYPRENYYNPDWVFNANENDLYTTRWKSYIEEAYNLQNKVVTGYFWLSDNDWNEFTFNKYITIGNVLYIVNKIIDYTPGLDQPTKVELIQIWDPTSYEN